VSKGFVPGKTGIENYDRFCFHGKALNKKRLSGQRKTAAIKNIKKNF
jgi:hypothetical protein